MYLYWDILHSIVGLNFALKTYTQHHNWNPLSKCTSHTINKMILLWLVGGQWIWEHTMRRHQDSWIRNHNSYHYSCKLSNSPYYYKSRQVDALIWNHQNQFRNLGIKWRFWITSMKIQSCRPLELYWLYIY